MRIGIKDNKPIIGVTPQVKIYLVDDGNISFWMPARDVKMAVKCCEIDNAKLCGNGIHIITPQLKVERINQVNLEKLYLFLKYNIVYHKDYRYADNYSYQYFIKEYKKDKKECLRQYNGYVAFYGNKVVAWVASIKTLGLEVLTDLYIDENIRSFKGVPNSIIVDVANSIFDKNPDAIMTGKICNGCHGNYSMSKQSTIDSDCKYALGHGEYITKGRTDRFVKAIENRYFINNVDLTKVEFKVIEGKNLSKLWQSKYVDGEFNGYWINNFNIESAVGFQYFHFDDPKKDAKFILAIYNDLIIGVIKLGIYNGDHQAIAYIDILKSCRNQGVATYMIKNLDKYLIKGLPLMLTEESDIGKMCHMAAKCKANIKSVKVKTYKEALKDGRYD